MANKKCVILGGGTFSHVRNHLALAAPAFGTTARRLSYICTEHSDKLAVELHLTRMAVPYSNLITNLDVAHFVDSLIADSSVKILFFNVAVCDFDGSCGSTPSDKYAARLQTRNSDETELRLQPTPKLISLIRKTRKDIFLVGFKTTCRATPQEQFISGLNLLKESSCNLVLANDTVTRNNMIITPEEASYHETMDRDAVLNHLVEMAYLRSHLTFTQSTVVGGESIGWYSDLVPNSLRDVVDHCIRQGAYKPFRGSTVGHFAVKLDDRTFLTSKRKTDFNELRYTGLVKIETDGPDTVFAYGSKPSVGGQSQRIVFQDHPGMNCIVHFHCDRKPASQVPVRSQREFECGSMECGENTSHGLTDFDGIKAVFLDKHGPNIVFNSNIDPQRVINFIENNFDLTSKTGGYTV